MTELAVFGIVIVLGATAVVLLPLLRPGRVDQSEPIGDELAARRAGLYREVLELEFDRRMGKLSEADYEDMRAVLLSKAGALLRQADDSAQDLDARVEAEIAAARAALAPRSRPAISAERG